MKYIVGFSGGIDSVFVAWYLKQQGHKVLLVNIKNTIEKNKCCAVPVELFKIADFLGLPLKVVDAIEDFKQYVIDDFVESYLNGQTPNPCINCNEKVRFRILNKIRQELNYDKIATGHYVRQIKTVISGKLQVESWKGQVRRDSRGFIRRFSKDRNLSRKSCLKNPDYPVYTFAIPKDTFKDQTYMLYRLIDHQDIVEHLDFPLGNFLKSEVKEIILKENIPVNVNKESQNICFVPDDDYPRFIKQARTINISSGKIVDKYGNYLGEHKGLIYYTIGQRKGLNLNTNKKMYVIKIDWKNNVLVVGDDKDLLQTNIKVSNWVGQDFCKKFSGELFGKIRYKAKLTSIKEIKANEVIFSEAVRAATPGQHLVIYGKQDNDIFVLGGGIIQESE